MYNKGSEFPSLYYTVLTMKLLCEYYEITM